MFQQSLLVFAFLPLISGISQKICSSSLQSNLFSFSDKLFEGIMLLVSIEMINNKARHNLIDAKYQQMAFQSVPTTLLFGIWSNKSEANLEDSDCTLRMLLFVSIKKEWRENLVKLLLVLCTSSVFCCKNKKIQRNSFSRSNFSRSAEKSMWCRVDSHDNSFN